MKIYLEKTLPRAQQFEVEDSFWEHYLANVRRLNLGDQLSVVGREQRVTAELVGFSPLQLKVIDRFEAEKPGYSLWLLQALTRKKKIETSIRLGTELGITHFLPLISKHTVRRPNKPQKQVERWRRIALDSTRITGRDWTPKIFPPVDFEDFPGQLSGVERIYWGEASGGPLGSCFADSPENVALVVGPEGDFSAGEKQFLSTTGAVPVSLGPEILRSGTAAVALSNLWLHYTRERSANR